MQFAVLADIHGNADALGAVLGDMNRLGVTDAVVLGDHFSGPLDACGTADMLMSRGFPAIRGNHDRWLLERDPAKMGPSDLHALRQLGPRQLDWLGSLPPTLRIFGTVFACHGTPGSDVEYWLERVDRNGRVRRATLAEIEAPAAGIDASLILCAHTHVPRLVRLGDGRIVLNPGSVGCPAYDDDTPVFHVMQTGTPDASYAIVEDTPEGWLVSFRAVPYDTTRMAGLAAANGRAEWARALATGWIDAGLPATGAGITPGS